MHLSSQNVVSIVVDGKGIATSYPNKTTTSFRNKLHDTSLFLGFTTPLCSESGGTFNCIDAYDVLE